MENTENSLSRAAHYKAVLGKKGIVFQKGLSATEVQNIESRYRFRFPPDLRDFLMTGLPVSNSFADWRSGSRVSLEAKLSWTYRGICFDIEHNGFWWNDWGVKPDNLRDAFAVAKWFVENAPRLIPIYGHRYISDSPSEAGNPVFSVYQTDIIYYGSNLWEYLDNEFSNAHQITEPVKRIPFWSEIIEGEGARQPD